jgi:uroporphyrinogen decarboxylase
VAATSRELVYQTLNFTGPARAPRDLWTLPIAAQAHPAALAAILEAYPPDMTGVDGFERERAPTRGDQYAIGAYTDEWGATFVSVQAGVIGEVKQPLIGDWATDVPRVHIPTAWLTVDRDAVNRACAATDKFTLAGCNPRPFEQLQFLRGTANLYMDLTDPPPELLAFMAELHAFYCELLQVWANTDVDALRMMDDWGSQRSLLISPAMWRHYFKPMYRDYVQIAHAAGKKFFMHSDGHILAIYPELIEIGVDALNSQLFCMGVEKLAPFAGQITFWGEIDRQRLLAFATPDEVEAAVRQVHEHLWRSGGCIAQCEFGAGARPENVERVFATWDTMTLQKESK